MKNCRNFMQLTDFESIFQLKYSGTAALQLLRDKSFELSSFLEIRKNARPRKNLSWKKIGGGLLIRSVDEASLARFPKSCGEKKMREE